MKVKDLKLGDVFRVLDHPVFPVNRHYVRERHHARLVAGQSGSVISLGNLADNEVDVLKHADPSPIRRFEDLLILADGDVVLTFLGAWRVYR